MGDDEIERRRETPDHGDETVGLVGGHGTVLWVVFRLPEVRRHAEPELARESLGDLTELGVSSHRAHVKVDVVDPEAALFGAVDLSPQLTLDLLEVGVVLVECLR